MSGKKATGLAVLLALSLGGRTVLADTLDDVEISGLTVTQYTPATPTARGSLNLSGNSYDLSYSSGTEIQSTGPFTFGLTFNQQGDITSVTAMGNNGGGYVVDESFDPVDGSTIAPTAYDSLGHSTSDLGLASNISFTLPDNFYLIIDSGADSFADAAKIDPLTNSPDPDNQIDLIPPPAGTPLPKSAYGAGGLLVAFYGLSRVRKCGVELSQP